MTEDTEKIQEQLKRAVMLMGLAGGNSRLSGEGFVRNEKFVKLIDAVECLGTAIELLAHPPASEVVKTEYRSDDWRSVLRARLFMLGDQAALGEIFQSTSSGLVTTITVVDGGFDVLTVEP